MRIQNNVTAMNTHRMYTLNNDAVAASAKKLSSGYRINSAADDAAGLAISEKMRSQIRGLNMATKNSQDAISLVQTAEGALQETQNMLQRMNELAVQAATGTNETLDRNALAKEFEQLKREINDIAEQTNFNNMKILDGSLSYEGLKRSAATSGINTTVEKLNGATTTAISQIATETVTGKDYVEGGEAAGAQFTLKGDEGPLGGKQVVGDTYNLQVTAGKETLQLQGDPVVGGDATEAVGKLYDGKTFEAIGADGKAVTYTDEDGNEQKVTYTAKWDDASGLTFERTNTQGLHQVGEVSAKLSQQVGSAAATGAVTATDGKIAKDPGWDVKGLDKTVEAGKTYTLEMSDGINSYGITYTATADDVADGKTIGAVLDGQTAKLHDQQKNSGTDGTATYTATYNEQDKTLRIGTAAANLGTDTQKTLTTTLTVSDSVEDISGKVSPSYTPGDGAGQKSTIELDLSKAAMGGLAEKGQTYTLSFTMDDGSVATLTGRAAEEGETIGATFANQTVTIGGQELKVTQVGGNGGEATKGKIVLTAADDTAPAGVTDFASSGAKVSLGTLSTAKSTLESPTATAQTAASPSINVASSSGLTTALTAADAGKTYTLTLTDDQGGKYEFSATAPTGASGSVAALFASAYDGSSDEKSLDIGGTKYKVTESSGALTIAEVTPASPAVDVKLPVSGTVTGSVSTFSKADEIKNGDKTDATVDRKTEKMELASKSYKVDKENLKVGDSLTIGGKTYTVSERTDTSDENNLKINKDTFISEVAGLVNADSESSGFKMDVTDSGFKLTETTKQIGDTVVDNPEDENYGKGLERSGAEFSAEFKTNSNLTKTTIEIDAVKLKAGDTVSVKVGDNEYTYEVKDGDKAENVIKGLYNEKAGYLTAEGGEAKAKGNAIIVEGKDVDVSAFIPREENDNSFNAVRIQVGALEGEQLSISIDAMNTKGLGLDDAHLMDPDNPEGLATLDQDAAGRAITATRDAINKISDQRATLGAMQNRLDHKIANLKISAENLTASESRIRDVDMAQEMTNFTKNNILSQAATAMLAQANSLPQNVLSLLG